MTEQIGFEIKLDMDYGDAVDEVTQVLETEGFGVLTEINVKTTLKEKLGEDFRPYVILGACNPPLAHQALLAAPEVGMMLPCNVTVEADENGGSIIRIIDPRVMMGVASFAENLELSEVARNVYEKLARVAKILSAQENLEVDKGFINNLLARGIIGVYDWEREGPQDILINIAIDTDTHQAGQSDEIEDCINYDALSIKVLTYVESIQRFTVEAVAQDIAKICLEEPQTQSVQVRVEKPGAVRFAHSVGVEIIRSR